ncbi:MAG: hypothetical protein CVV42_08640 [Candidatus Riflebacteria bacterium HGW-Riflebacteria-2]|jgi:class 3 adenylate cyclase|nr:MAG: hypothetical protein CVV42_08640 [Candidatus Riflebacteria bacterium HGW-Riflebacteria-2]
MKTIKPDRPSNTRLFVFWLIVFVFPLITAKVLVNLHTRQMLLVEDSNIREILRHEMELFLADLSLGSQIEKQTKQVERLLLEEFANRQTKASPEEVCSLASQHFATTGIFMPVLIAAYMPGSGGTEVLRINPDYLNPGRKSLEIILKHLDGLASAKTDESQGRLYQQICRSTFGGLLQPAELPGIMSSGFLSKGSGDRAFVYHNRLATGRKKDQTLILLTVFAEAKVGLRDLLRLAAQKSENPATARSCSLMRTAADRDYFFDRHDRLCYAVPIPPAVLRTGSHAGKDWYTSALSSKKALQKPGRLPFAVISHTPLPAKQASGSWHDQANLLLLVILFTGTALVHQIATNRFARAPINRKFALCILLSTVLPFAVLIVSAYRYARHFSLSVIQTRLHKMSNDLYLIESNIHNHNQRQKFKIATFLKRLQNISHLAAAKLKDMLDEEYGSLYIGYILFRNDATLVERLPDEKTTSGDDRKKLLLMRDLTLAQIYSVFVNAGVLTTDFAHNIEKVPDFRRWQAFAEHYDPIDRNSFCLQNGEYFPAQMSERQHIEYSTHNLFRRRNAKVLWAGLILLFDSRATSENYLNLLPGHTFIRAEDNAVTHTAIYQVNSQKQLDRLIAWPRNALSDSLMLQAAASLANGKTESAWYRYDEHGTVSLFCARAISDAPFVITARSELNVAALLEAALPVLLLTAIIYLLALIKLLSLILADSFIRPVNMIMQGLTAIDQGHYPAITCDSTNELGNLVGDFNSMVEGMRQRQILERFISDEVSQTIAESGSDSGRQTGSLVYRAIMFIHINRFEEICENLAPESVITLLNLYFSTLEPAVTAQGGQIDKYIGDAIMVSFAAERCGGQPELAAAKTALLCHEKTPDLLNKLTESGLPEIVIGTGIAAGQVILGKIGSHSGRKDFTLIGDAVNLAARLEAESHFDNKAHILVSENVKTAAATLNFEAHARLKVKGKETAIDVFELKEPAG